MSSKASVKKNNLQRRIEAEGFRSVIPCNRCVRLHHTCFRIGDSTRCSEYVRASGSVKCVMPNPTYSDAEWRRLVKLQEEITEERRAALAKVMRLKR